MFCHTGSMAIVLLLATMLTQTSKCITTGTDILYQSWLPVKSSLKYSLRCDKEIHFTKWYTECPVLPIYNESLVPVSLVQWSLWKERRTWNKLSEDLGSNACYSRVSFMTSTNHLPSLECSFHIYKHENGFQDSFPGLLGSRYESEITLEIENGNTIPRSLQESEGTAGTKARMLQGILVFPRCFPSSPNTWSISSVGKMFYEMFALCFFDFYLQ